jgi:ABC-2 type transport system ATP-binding protein
MVRHIMRSAIVTIWVRSEMNAIELNDVCKDFGPVQAVNQLSVQVPAGSIYGFLGPNGAGKTTTLRMIMNIIRPDSGSISIFGNGSMEEAKSRMGYMPEERGLYRKMTVSKILAYFAALKGVSAEAIARRVPQWLERIELSQWAGKKVEDLSRGMHQKLQFAVTAINEPDLLILDEPFSGLDPINLDLLKGILLEMRDQGKTIIFSTHAMHDAEELCDFILLINKGRSILDGQLSRIRAQNQSNAVTVEIEGDTTFLRALPIVKDVQMRGKLLDITLAEGGDPQELLRALAEKVRVQRFEVKMPSLHEIFVNLVGASNAENS